MFLASFVIELLLAVSIVTIISVIIGTLMGLDPMMSIVLGFLLVAIILVGFFSIPRPVKIFETAIVTPIPKSVKILHAKNTGFFDQTIWLHFTIAPHDLQQILTTQGYTRTSNEWKRKYPSWWKIEQWGENMQQYDSPDSEWVKSLYINAPFDEVYCFAYHKFRAD